MNSVIEVCDLISANEIKNMKVERISIKVCSCWILKSRIGDSFEANVTGIEEWGIYVSIDDPIAEGLVRYRDIAGDDFYVFNPDQGLAFGKRSGRTFRRGDKVMVQLLRVDPLRGQADFSITEKLSPEPKKRRTREDTERDIRNFNERADRAAAAEALGYVSQPDEDDDYEPEYVSRGRRGRRDFDGPTCLVTYLGLFSSDFNFSSFWLFSCLIAWLSFNLINSLFNELIVDVISAKDSM